MTEPIPLPIRRLPGTEDLPLPAYKTAHAAGMDLYAAVAGEVTIAPGDRMAVPTGIAMEIPVGYEAQVRPRSGLARDHGIALVNSPGTIDADFRGEIQVLLLNTGREPFTLKRGERVAQCVLAPVARAVLVPVDALGETERGAGGFGHTGRHG